LRILHAITAAILLASALACSTKTQTGAMPEAEEFIGKAAKDVSGQRFDSAMEHALKALELSREEGDRLHEVQALQTIVGIDIMTSRDADAWSKAVEAEGIARRHGFRRELAGILISKAKLCSYAEISPETGRNDEGLAYAEETLQIARELGDAEQEAEACFVIGSLNINKNRWSDPQRRPLPFPLAAAGRAQRGCPPLVCRRPRCRSGR